MISTVDGDGVALTDRPVTGKRLDVISNRTGRFT